MIDPEFVAPTSLGEAVDMAGADDALVVAGGTSVALLVKEGLVEPGRLVWLGRLAELTGITDTGGGALRIGALTTLADIATATQVRAHHPMIAQAARVVANPRIRAVATIGGAVVHADPRQDLPPALLAADAAVRIVGTAGERTVPLRDGFFRGFLETALGPGELVTHLLLPPAGRAPQAYRRFTPQSADDYPTVSVAARLELTAAGEVRGLSLALGGVAPAPLLVTDLPALVPGRTPDSADIAGIAEAAAAATSPVADRLGSVRYKSAMAAVWTRRVLTELVRAHLTGTGGSHAERRD
jgi:carbon-monoxide dehydrogenase medium subunit